MYGANRPFQPRVSGDEPAADSEDPRERSVIACAPASVELDEEDVRSYRVRLPGELYLLDGTNEHPSGTDAPELSGCSQGSSVRFDVSSEIHEIAVHSDMQRVSKKTRAPANSGGWSSEEASESLRAKKQTLSPEEAEIVEDLRTSASKFRVTRLRTDLFGNPDIGPRVRLMILIVDRLIRERNGERPQLLIERELDRVWSLSAGDVSIEMAALFPR